MTRRGACAQAVWPWVAAIHSTTASRASGLGRITYRVMSAASWSSRTAPSMGGGLRVVMRFLRSGGSQGHGFVAEAADDGGAGFAGGLAGGEPGRGEDVDRLGAVDRSGGDHPGDAS